MWGSGSSGCSGLITGNRNGHDSSSTFSFSSLIRSAVSVQLRSHIVVTAAAFNREVDPVLKLFVDKIRECRMQSQASGGPTDTGPEAQQDLESELFKLKEIFGEGDINMSKTSHVKILSLKSSKSPKETLGLESTVLKREGEISLVM